MDKALLIARNRATHESRELECDANGALHCAVEVEVTAGATTIADGADVAQGATTDAEAAAGNGSIVALLKRLRTLLGDTLDVQMLGPYSAVLGLEAVAASTAYVLVDISDSANFPHTGGTAIRLKRLRLHAEKASDGVYDVWVGVVKEVDASDGSVDFFHCFHLEAVGNPTDSTDRFAQELEFGLSLAVAGGSPSHFVTNEAQDDNVSWQTDTALTSPVGTSAPGVGDLVVWVEEVSGTGTLDFVISADYDTYTPD